MKPRQANRQHIRRNRLTTAFRSLVPPIANRYAQSSPEAFDDLLQVGMLGLLRAAERYSPADAIPFERFARPHIRGAILHHLRDSAWLVRLPRRQSELQQQIGRTMTSDDPAISGETRACLSRWSALVRPVSLEAMDVDRIGTMATPDAAEREQGFDDSNAYNPEALDPAWSQRSSAQLLELIPARHRQVVRYVVLEGWSYRRTAAQMSVSAATVQRLLHQGLADLRDRLSAPGRSQQRHAPSAAAVS